MHFSAQIQRARAKMHQILVRPHLQKSFVLDLNRESSGVAGTMHEIAAISTAKSYLLAYHET